MRIPKENALEQRIDFLMEIGRHIEMKEDEEGNIELKLKGRLRNYPQASDGECAAWEFLRDKKLVQSYDQRFSDLDGGTTIIRCKLTDRGQKIYEKTEKSYAKFIRDLAFSFDLI